MADIGFQDGIAGFVAWVRKIDPAVKYRPLDDRPDDPSGWYWLEKVETRLLRHLKDEHDAENDVPPPPPPPPDDDPPPPPGPILLAPQSYNRGSRGQDARYNIRINCKEVSPDRFADALFMYDGSGLCLGGRSGKYVEGLKPADMMDGKDPWQPYEWLGNTFPPYPPGSYEV